jgi:aldehyde:ferredoxin oxidoreductase
LFTIDGGGWALSGVRDLFNAITGWDYSVEDMLLAGERGFTSQRLMNIRDGYGAASDVLPKKMFKAASQGKRAGQVPPLADMLRDYYEVRGWDSSGVPTDSALARLGLKR